MITNRTISYIIAAVLVFLLKVLALTLYCCYYHRKCCFRNCGREAENPTIIIPPPNQPVTIVTSNPAQQYTTFYTQPMTSNYPIQTYPAYPSQPQAQTLYPASSPGYSQYQKNHQLPAN